MFDFSELKMRSALGNYFSKVNVTPDYMGFCLHEAEPRYANEIRLNRLFFPREKKLDFSFFKELFGYEMPDILKAYYSICHVDVRGYHKNAPDKTDEIMLGSTVTDKLFEWFDPKSFWFNNFDTNKYIPIGITGYYYSYVFMERDTGHILIEDYDENDDSIRFFTFLSESLTNFIKELKPTDSEFFSFLLRKLIQKDR